MASSQFVIHFNLLLDFLTSFFCCLKFSSFSLVCDLSIQDDCKRWWRWRVYMMNNGITLNRLQERKNDVIQCSNAENRHRIYVRSNQMSESRISALHTHRPLVKQEQHFIDINGYFRSSRKQPSNNNEWSSCEKGERTTMERKSRHADSRSIAAHSLPFMAFFHTKGDLNPKLEVAKTAQKRQ